MSFASTSINEAVPTTAVADGSSFATGGRFTAADTVTVTVSPAPNRNPVANDDIGAIAAPAANSVTVDVVANDTDPDGDPLTIVVTPPPNPSPAPTPDNGVGAVEVLGNSIRFTILPSFATPGITIVTIPYTVTDGRGGSASAILTITVTM